MKFAILLAVVGMSLFFTKLHYFTLAKKLSKQFSDNSNRYFRENVALKNFTKLTTQKNEVFY